jgi:hypothetical protein
MRKQLALVLLSCALCVSATAQQPALVVGTATAVAKRQVVVLIGKRATQKTGQRK